MLGLDQFAILLPLGAVALGIAKDLRKPENKFGHIEALALILGLVGASVAYYQLSTKEARAQEERKLAAEDRKKADETKARTEEIKKAADDISQETKSAIKHLEALQDGLRTSTTSLQSAVQASTRTLDDSVLKTKNSISDELGRTNAALGQLQTANKAVLASTNTLGESLKAVDNAVAKSEKILLFQVQETAKQSAKTFDKSLKGYTEKTLQEFDTALGRGFTRVPFTIGQNQSISLQGTLSGFRIQVDEIRRWNSNEKTRIQFHHPGGRIEEIEFVFHKGLPSKNYYCRITPDGNPTPCIRFEHSGHYYRLELLPRTPTNLFGQADDTLTMQVIPE